MTQEEIVQLNLTREEARHILHALKRTLARNQHGDLEGILDTPVSFPIAKLLKEKGFDIANTVGYYDSSKLIIDKNYLKNWSMNNQIGKNANQLKNTPVVYVSWFAAKKYCECQGKRLPTIDEWEFVGRASQTKMDATNEPAFLQQILDWYAKPTPSILNNVGIGFKNVYGLYDIHGLVWEWNLDFIAALSIKDSRDGNNLNSTEFCGAASNNSSTPQNYAAFMRYAMRSSLKANYSQPNLGFRCVKEVK